MNSISDSNKNQFYFVYSLATAIFVASLVFSDRTTLIVSASMLLLSVALLNSGHVINNLLIKRSKIIEIAGNYRLSSSLNSMSREAGGLFKSTSLALLRPRPGSTMKSDSIKDLLDGLSEQFEFSLELLEADKSKILENLRTKLRMKEIALSRINGKSYEKDNALKRQIDSINGDISSLASGGKSFQFAIKLKSIYSSENQGEAEFCAARNIETLANKFSAVLGLDYEILRGERLLEYEGV